MLNHGWYLINNFCCFGCVCFSFASKRNCAESLYCWQDAFISFEWLRNQPFQTNSPFEILTMSFSEIMTTSVSGLFLSVSKMSQKLPHFILKRFSVLVVGYSSVWFLDDDNAVVVTAVVVQRQYQFGTNRTGTKNGQQFVLYHMCKCVSVCVCVMCFAKEQFASHRASNSDQCGCFDFFHNVAAGFFSLGVYFCRSNRLVCLIFSYIMNANFGHLRFTCETLLIRFVIA